MIDSLYWFGNPSESGFFDRCEIDSNKDAVAKTESLWYSNGSEFKIALDYWY